MKKIINDWSDFCEIGKSFEEGYFYTLFMEDITSEEIREVFKYFPNSEILIDRMEKFLFEPKPNIENFDTKKNELERLIKLDFHERKPILEKLDIFSKFNLNPIFIFNSDFESISLKVLDDVCSQSFYDFMRMQKLITDKKVCELYNALYGITYDFDYQLYLFLPLLKTNYTAEYLYQFKRLGGIYAISENGVYFSNI
jgi:hypothetical protein